MRKLIALLSVVGGIAVALASPAQAVEVQKVISPGGIEAWLVEDHLAPIISVRFAVRGGAALDPDGLEGLAEMTSALLDEGAGDLDSQAFRQRLEDLSITLRYQAFMDTFRGQLRTLTRNRDEAFDLLRLSLTEPRFDDEPVERIRSQIQSGLARALNDPDAQASKVFWATVFPDHPYGRQRRGTAESIAKITVDDMRGFVAERLGKDALLIGVVGDITAEDLGLLLDSTFGGLPETSAPFEIADVEPAGAGEVVVVEADVPQSVMIVGQPGLKRADEDYYAATVLNHILGGGSFTSRLYEEVREKRGLAYSVGSFLNPLDHAALWMGSVGTQNERAGETVDVILAEWQKIRDEGVTEAELEETKTNLTGSFALRFDNTDAIANMLVGMQLSDLGIDYLDRRNGFIESVTMDDLQRVAERVLSADLLTIIAVGQPEGLTATQRIDG